MIMCTEHHADEIMVCDVAIATVHEHLAELPHISIEQIDFEGNLIRNDDPAQTAAFRRLLHQAISRHGGALTGQ